MVNGAPTLLSESVASASVSELRATERFLLWRDDALDASSADSPEGDFFSIRLSEELGNLGENAEVRCSVAQRFSSSPPRTPHFVS